MFEVTILYNSLSGKAMIILCGMLFQLYESRFDSFEVGKNDKEGLFTVDSYSGKDISFKVYFQDLVESYIKSISVENHKGNVYSTIMDTSMSLHYLSVYDAPLDEVCMIDMSSNIHHVRCILWMFSGRFERLNVEISPYTSSFSNSR